jgi:hypoxanthine phosphoribosyltransferase
MALKIGNKVYLSWDDINILVEDLCQTIASSGADIKSITGIKQL